MFENIDVSGALKALSPLSDKCELCEEWTKQEYVRKAGEEEEKHTICSHCIGYALEEVYFSGRTDESREENGTASERPTDDTDDVVQQEEGDSMSEDEREYLEEHGFMDEGGAKA